MKSPVFMDRTLSPIPQVQNLKTTSKLSKRKTIIKTVKAKQNFTKPQFVEQTKRKLFSIRV